MQNEYKAFYHNHFTQARYKQYQKDFQEQSGKLYTLSTAPYFLKSRIASKIKETILPTLIKLLSSKEYQESVYARGWFLPKVEVSKEDFVGCADFHIHGDEVRLIELNFFLPGHIGFVELFPKLFSKNFDYPFEIFADGFEQKLANFLKQRFAGTKIALAVNHLGLSVHYFEHYKYLEKSLNKHGIDAKVVYAKDAGISSSNKPMWDNEEFDGVFNIVIPRIWEHNSDVFVNYTKLYAKASDLFFPNPWCWTIGDKRFLTLLSNLKAGDFGLDAQDVEILKSITLKTRLMSEFKSIQEICDAFKDEKHLVLKPIDNFHTQGVYIQPSLEIMEEVFCKDASRYVVQELFNAEEFYYEDENATPIRPWRAQLRTEFFDGEFSNFRAYGYSDPFGLSPMMPVVVKDA
ncbi:hypothetical protein [Sulfurospirillum sp.]|uniref:hypothetical protein n=1 Tax=Sulfurospirillum sp. TaxID=2053622 RepID=UPI002FDD3CC8